MTENEIGTLVVDVAVNVHKEDSALGCWKVCMRWFWLNSLENEG